MKAETDEYFGSAEQAALVRRGRLMFDVVQDDPRLYWHGRTVGVAGPGVEAALDRLAGMARLVGHAGLANVPDGMSDDLVDEISRRGLTPDRLELLSGDAEAIGAARRLVDAHTLPAGLRPVWIGPKTPTAFLARLADLTVPCGVLLPAGSALRGVTRRAVAVALVDPEGAPVATGASILSYHPDSELAGQAWWGMLATRIDWRGQGLASWCGARAMTAMHDTFGIASVMTGVRADNAPSQALCARLGVTPSGSVFLGAADTALLGSGRMTR